MENTNTVVLRVPLEEQSSFVFMWRELRMAEGLQPDFDLPQPVETANFDGGAMAEWVMHITQAATPIITGIFGFLVARRGEIEIERHGQKIKMKGMKPSQLNEVIKILDAPPSDDDSN